jgi:hypothetical protein
MVCDIKANWLTYGYVLPAVTLSEILHSVTQCIYVFRMILAIQY